MFAFTESVHIGAPAPAIWEALSDLERWWMPSNPDHIELTLPEPCRGIGPGTPVAFAERIAGIPGDATGTITEWTPGREVTWEGEARYRYLGLRFRVREGVTWRLDDDGGGATLSAHVWAAFPRGIRGRLVEWYATHCLDVVEQDRAHARHELQYLKARIEAGDL